MMGWSKRFLFLTLMSFMVLASAGSGLRAAVDPPPEGGVLPRLELPVPEDAQARAYLGLPGTGKFTIPEIKARLVIIEVFSMY